MDHLNDIRLVMRQIQNNIDSNNQHLLDAILGYGAADENSEQQKLQQQFIQEKARELQHQTEEKNRLISALADALAERPSLQSWAPIVQYFKWCNEDSYPPEADVVEQLVQAIRTSTSSQSKRPSAPNQAGLMEPAIRLSHEEQRLAAKAAAEKENVSKSTRRVLWNSSEPSTKSSSDGSMATPRLTSRPGPSSEENQRKSENWSTHVQQGSELSSLKSMPRSDESRIEEKLASSDNSSTQAQYGSDLSSVKSLPQSENSAITDKTAGSGNWSTQAQHGSGLSSVKSMPRSKNMGVEEKTANSEDWSTEAQQGSDFSSEKSVPQSEKSKTEEKSNLKSEKPHLTLFHKKQSYVVTQEEDGEPKADQPNALSHVTSVDEKKMSEALEKEKAEEEMRQVTEENDEQKKTGIAALFQRKKSSEDAEDNEEKSNADKEDGEKHGLARLFGSKKEEPREGSENENRKVEHDPDVPENDEQKKSGLGGLFHKKTSDKSEDKETDGETPGPKPSLAKLFGNTKPSEEPGNSVELAKETSAEANASSDEKPADEKTKLGQGSLYPRNSSRDDPEKTEQEPKSPDGDEENKLKQSFYALFHRKSSEEPEEKSNKHRLSALFNKNKSDPENKLKPGGDSAKEDSVLNLTQLFDETDAKKHGSSKKSGEDCKEKVDVDVDPKSGDEPKHGIAALFHKKKTDDQTVANKEETCQTNNVETEDLSCQTRASWNTAVLSRTLSPQDVIILPSANARRGVEGMEDTIALNNSEARSKSTLSLVSGSAADMEAARVQQQAYVLSRLEELHQKLEENAKLSGELEMILKEMAVTMNQCSGALLTRLDLLDSDKAALEKSHLPTVVEELKFSVAMNVIRGSKILAAVDSLTMDKNWTNYGNRQPTPIPSTSTANSDLSYCDYVLSTANTLVNRLSKASGRTSYDPTKDEEARPKELSHSSSEDDPQSEDEMDAMAVSTMNPSPNRLSVSEPGAGEWRWHRRITGQYDGEETDERAMRDNVATWMDGLLEAAEGAARRSTIREETEAEVNAVERRNKMKAMMESLDLLRAEMMEKDNDMMMVKEELRGLENELNQKLREKTKRVSLPKVPEKAHVECQVSSLPVSTHTCAVQTSQPPQISLDQGLTKAAKETQNEAKPIALPPKHREVVKTQDAKAEIMLRTLTGLQNEMTAKDLELTSVKEELLKLEEDLQNKLKARQEKQQQSICPSASVVESPLTGRFSLLKTEIRRKISTVEQLGFHRSLRPGWRSSQIIENQPPAGVEVKQLGPGFVAVSWPQPKQPPGDAVVGYQVQLNGEMQHKVRNPERRWAVLEESAGRRKISVVAETAMGEHILVGTASPRQHYQVKIGLQLPK